MGLPTHLSADSTTFNDTQLSSGLPEKHNESEGDYSASRGRREDKLVLADRHKLNSKYQQPMQQEIMGLHFSMKAAG